MNSSQTVSLVKIISVWLLDKLFAGVLKSLKITLIYHQMSDPRMLSNLVVALVCRTKVSCILVPQDLGSRENYGELDLYYFNCARV